MLLEKIHSFYFRNAFHDEGASNYTYFNKSCNVNHIMNFYLIIAIHLSTQLYLFVCKID